MALIICSECGNQMSDKAQYCPKCGTPNPNATPIQQVAYQPQPEKSFCKYCGSEIQSRAAFCSSCGMSQATLPQQQGARSMSQQPQHFYGQPAQQPAYMAGVYQQPLPQNQNQHTQSSNTTTTNAQTTSTIVNVQEGRSNGMGTAGFIFSLLAFFVCWVPIVDIIVWFLGALFSFIGLFKAPRGLAIAGFIISFIGIFILVTFFGALIRFAGE